MPNPSPPATWNCPGCQRTYKLKPGSRPRSLCVICQKEAALKAVQSPPSPFDDLVEAVTEIEAAPALQMVFKAPTETLVPIEDPMPTAPSPNTLSPEVEAAIAHYEKLHRRGPLGVGWQFLIALAIAFGAIGPACLFAFLISFSGGLAISFIWVSFVAFLAGFFFAVRIISVLEEIRDELRRARPK